jgi:AbrB family looped-hinge helix DNA binding protein
MKVGSFTTTNDKGQLVIPKEIRETLGIDSHTTLTVTLAGNGMYIYPVEEFLTKGETESSYVQLLAKTQGMWADEQVDGQRKQMELDASRARKTSW